MSQTQQEKSKIRKKKPMTLNQWYRIRRIVASVLSFAMVFGNVGNSANIALAGDGTAREEFRIHADEIMRAAEQALSEGNPVSGDLGIGGKDKSLVKEYEALFAADGSLYEIFPVIDTVKGVDGIDLRVFMRIDGEADPGSYALTGEEKLLFLYVNDGDETVAGRLNIDGQVSGFTTVKPYDAVFGQKQLPDAPGAAGAGNGTEESTSGEEAADQPLEGTDGGGQGGSTEDAGDQGQEDGSAAPDQGGSGEEAGDASDGSDESQAPDEAGDASESGESGNDGSGEDGEIKEDEPGAGASSDEGSQDSGDRADAAEPGDQGTGGSEADGGHTSGGSDESGKAEDSEDSDDNKSDSSSSAGDKTDHPAADSADSGSSADEKGSDSVDTGSSADDKGSDSKDTGSSADHEGTDGKDSGSSVDDKGTDSKDAGSSVDDKGTDSKDTGSSADDKGSDSKDAGSSADDKGTGSQDSAGSSSDKGNAGGEDSGNKSAGTGSSDRESAKDTSSDRGSSDSKDTGDSSSDKGSSDSKDTGDSNSDKGNSDSKDSGGSSSDKGSSDSGEKKEALGISLNQIRMVADSLGSGSDAEDTDDAEEDEDEDSDGDPFDAEDAAALVNEEKSFNKIGNLSGRTYNLVSLDDSITARAFVLSFSQIGFAPEELEEAAHQITYSIDPVGSAALVKAAKSVKDGAEVTFGVKPQVGYRVAEVTANGDALETADVADGTEGVVWYTIPEVLESQEVDVVLTEMEEGGHPEYAYSKTLGGVKIDLFAEEGILPAGTRAEVKEVTAQVEEAVKEKVEESDEVEAVTAVLAYDITLYDASGNKLDDSWSQDGYVKVSFSGAQIEEKSKEADAIEIRHVDTDVDATREIVKAEDIASVEKVAETVEVAGEETVSEVSFEAEHFSVYTITFTSNWGWYSDKLKIHVYDVNTGAAIDTETTEISLGKTSGSGSYQISNIRGNKSISVPEGYSFVKATTAADFGRSGISQFYYSDTQCYATRRTDWNWSYRYEDPFDDLYLWYEGKQITFDANSGRGKVPDPIAIKVSGETIQLPGQGGLSRSGYVFLGWSTEPNPDLTKGMAVIYPEGSSFVAQNSQTVFAVWAKTNSTAAVHFFIRLDGVIPTEPSGAIAAEYTGHNTAGEMYFNTGALIEERFVSDPTGKAVEGNLKKKPSTQAIITALIDSKKEAALKDAYGIDIKTLKVEDAEEFSEKYYVLWYVVKRSGDDLYWHVDGVLLKRDLVNLAYDGNGADSEADGEKSQVPPGQQYEKNTIATVASGETLFRKGYEFAGWNTEADGSGISYAAGDKIQLDQDTTLYAQWIPKNKSYTVDKEAEVYDKEGNKITEAKAGDTITYKITIKNVGNVDLVGEEISDRFTVDGTEQKLTLSKDNKSQGTYDGNRTISLKAGETLILTSDYQVTASDKFLLNVVTVGKVSDEVSTGIADNADWNVEKKVEGTTGENGKAVVGDQLAYTVSITNTGNIELNELTVSDRLNGSDVDLSQATVTGATYANGKLSGIPVGGTATLSYTYTVQASDKKLANVVKAGEKEATNEVEVKENKAYEVEKKAYISEREADKAEVGDRIIYKITVKNTGNIEIEEPITDIFTVDGSEEKLALSKEKGSAGEYTETGKVKLGVGETITLVSEEYQVKAADKTLVNVVHVGNPDDHPDHTKTVEIPVDPKPAWSVEKTVSGMTGQDNKAKVNDGLTYTITIQNTGNVKIEKKLTDIFKVNGKEAKLSLRKEGESAGKYNAETGIVTLEVSESITLTSRYQVQASDKTLHNTVTVGEDKGDPSSEVVTEVEDKPDFSVSKEVTSSPNSSSGKYAIGELITYAITVSNTGNVKLENLTVEDRTDGKGTVEIDSSEKYQVTENRVTISSIEPGETVVIKCSYQVVEQDNGRKIKNTAIAENGESKKEDSAESEVEQTYTIYVRHEFAKGDEDEQVKLREDYSLAHRKPGDRTIIKADEVKGYTVYPNGEQEVTIVDQDITVIFVYFKDEVGGIDPKDPDDEDKPDGIPDKYQIKVTYSAENGTVDLENPQYVTLLKDGKWATAADGGAGYLEQGQIASAEANPGYKEAQPLWSPNKPSTETKLTKDTEYKATFEARTDMAYKVEYYYQNAGNGEFEHDASLDVIRTDGTTGQTVKVTDKDKKVSSKKDKNYVLDIKNSGNVWGAECKADESTVLKVYFKLQFTVTYRPGAHGKFDPVTVEKLDYGVNTPDGPKELTGNSGYTFAGWSPEQAEKVTGDQVYVAQWKANADTPYKVEHYLQNSGEDWVLKLTEMKSGTTDTAAKYEVKSFEGFTYDANRNQYVSRIDEKKEIQIIPSGDEVTISGDGRLVIKLYYTKASLSYEVHYFYDNEENTDAAVKDQGFFGTSIPYTAANTAKYNGHNYALDRVEEPSGGVILSDPGQNIVNVYYALDEIGGTDPDNPTDPENPDAPDKPDGIPDKYQIPVVFASVNGTVDGRTQVERVVTLRDLAGKLSETGSYTLTNTDIPNAKAADGYNPDTKEWDAEPNGAVIDKTDNTKKYFIVSFAPSENTGYQVEYYYQAEGSYPVQADSIKNRTATTDTEVRLTDSDKIAQKAGYVYDESAGNVENGWVAANGSLVLKVYFKQQFTVTYKPGIHGNFDAAVTENLDYGANTPKEPDPIGQAGYTFTGWSPERIETVTSNQVYVAQWKANADTPYKVEHYLQNLNEGWSLETVDEMTGTTDTAAQYEAKSFDGFTYDASRNQYVSRINEEKEIPIISSGDKVTISGDGKLVIKLYYVRKSLSYEVHYFYGDEEDTSAMVTGEGVFGTDIPYTADRVSEYNGHNYVLSQIEKLSGGIVSNRPQDNVVNVYYLLDEIGGTDPDNPTDPENPDNPDKPDGIPDRYQVIFTYESADTSKGTITGTWKEAHTIYELTTNPDGTITAGEETPANPSAEVNVSLADGYEISQWMDSKGTAYASLDEIKAKAFAEDMTFTVSFKETAQTYMVRFLDDDREGEEVAPAVGPLAAVFGQGIIGAEQKIAVEGYVFVRADNLIVGTDNTANIVTLYYSRDEIGGTDPDNPVDPEDPDNPTDPENPDNPNRPDGIPDKYQIIFRYISEDENRGTVSGTQMEVHTIYELTTAEDGTITAVGPNPVNPGANVTVVPAEGFRFVNWTAESAGLAREAGTAFDNTAAIRSAEYSSDTDFIAHFAEGGSDDEGDKPNDNGGDDGNRPGDDNNNPSGGDENPEEEGPGGNDGTPGGGDTGRPDQPGDGNNNPSGGDNNPSGGGDGSGGGSGSGGGNGGRDRDRDRGTGGTGTGGAGEAGGTGETGTDTIAIDPETVPLASLPDDINDAATGMLILDEDVPLFGLPKTGDNSIPMGALMGMMFVSFFGALGIAKKRKEDER